MEYEIGYKKRRFTWPEGRNTEEQNEQYNPSTPNISFGSIASTQHLRSNIVRTPEKILKHVEQPPGFEIPDKPNHVYKLRKALYGLKMVWNKPLGRGMNV